MNLKHPVFAYSQVAEVAEKFLVNYYPSLLLPIPIEVIAERDLGINIIPVCNMKQNYDIDACLDSSLRRIFIDMDKYMKYENRSRFSIAHEIGHLVLHRGIFTKLNIRTEEDILNLTANTNEEEYSWLQHQANWFAGLVLVPRKKLIEAIQNRSKKTVVSMSFEELLPIFPDLENEFQVSGEVLIRRLEKEGICKPESSF